MNKEYSILGIDIGTVAIALVQMSLEGKILKTHYAFHNGDILKTLLSILNTINDSAIKGIASTSSSPNILKDAHCYDSRIACITAAKKNHQHMGAILTVGGEKFNFITFDKDGNYRNLKTNTSCAAGTGSISAKR